MQPNPYIGPRPYQRGEGNFFGREREGKELAWLILAERAVLFYAQSGAGKTSLLNARVIPILEQKGVQVLPVARVGSALPEGIAPEQVDNIFAYSALLTLAAESDLAPETLLKHTLLSYLQTYALQNPQSKIQNPTLLILDQFEEIATTHRDHWEQAEDFFHQVRAALDEIPGLGVLFVLREDYVAELDPYTPLLPSHLQARFRMERLGHQAAIEAVVKPAANAGCSFSPGVAERLVDDLRQLKRQETGFLTETRFLGPYVEPVQLQVVCNRLWEGLPDQLERPIRWSDVRRHGNVNRALTDFYENALTEIKGQVSERRLRRWFSEQLITSQGTRGLVMRGPQETAGLPNAIVKAVEDYHLIRSETRAGARWYELAHDRLVDPIAQANREWDAAQDQIHPWRAMVRQWQTTHSETLLSQGQELKDAQTWLTTTDPDEVELYEREFIQKSRQAESARVRKRQFYIAGGVIAVILMAIMLGLTLWAFNSQQKAEQAEQQARARMLVAQGQAEFEDNPLLGLRLALEGLIIAPQEDQSELMKQVEELAQQGRLLTLGHDVEQIYADPNGVIFIFDREHGPGEVRHIVDGSVVLTLTDEIAQVYFSPAISTPYFVVSYKNIPAELRRTLDSSVVMPLTDKIAQVYFSPDPNATYFVITYVDADPKDDILALQELRRTADGALLATLTQAQYTYFSPGPSADYLAIFYKNTSTEANAPTTTELRRTTDGAVVATLTGVEKLNFSPDPETTYFVVHYKSAVSEANNPQVVELRRCTDGSIVPLTGTVHGVYFSSTSDATYLWITYYDAAMELRHLNGEMIKPFYVNADMRILYSQTPNATVFVIAYKQARGELRRMLDGELITPLTGEVKDVTFSSDPDASYLMVLYEDAPAEIRRATGDTIKILPDGIYSAAFSPDLYTNYLQTYHNAGTRYESQLHRVAEGETAPLTDNLINNIHYSPAPSVTNFVVSYNDATTELRRTADGAIIDTFPGTVRNVVFSSDPNIAYFTVIYDNTNAAELRRTANGKMITPLPEQTNWVEYSPDPNATYLIVNNYDGSSDLWHTDTGHHLIDLGLGKSQLVFTPEGNRLIVRYTDGRTHLLDLEWLTTMHGEPSALTPENLIRIICEGPMASGFLDENTLLSHLKTKPQVCR